jgi:hypothetical protein
LYLSNRFPDKNRELLDKKRKVSLEKSGICQTWALIYCSVSDTENFGGMETNK